MRVAVKAAASEPAAPTEKTIPITPAESPSSRTTNTRMIENATLEKKFEVAVQPACARRFGIAEDEAEPLLELGPQARLLPVGRRDRRGLLGLADPEEEETRADEAECVDEHGVGRREDLDEDAAEAGPADLRGRAADLELRVAVDDLLALDERRQVRLVRDVEEDLERADEEADDEQLRRASARPRSTRSGRSRGAPRGRSRPTIRIGRRGSRSTHTPAGSVKRMNGRNSDDPERRDLEGAGVEDEDRDERHRELTDLRAELADRLRRPELQEVGVAPEAAGAARGYASSPRGGRGVGARKSA